MPRPPTKRSVSIGAMVDASKNLPVVSWNSTAAAPTTAMISRPPLVGVPSLTRWLAGPSRRTRLPKPEALQQLQERRHQDDHQGEGQDDRSERPTRL